MPGKNNIQIDSDIAQKLRLFVFDKHGTLYGKIKTEVELAILRHIKEGD